MNLKSPLSEAAPRTSADMRSAWPSAARPPVRRDSDRHRAAGRPRPGPAVHSLLTECQCSAMSAASCARWRQVPPSRARIPSPRAAGETRLRGDFACSLRHWQRPRRPLSGSPARGLRVGSAGFVRSSSSLALARAFTPRRACDGLTHPRASVARSEPTRFPVDLRVNASGTLETARPPARALAEQVGIL